MKKIFLMLICICTISMNLMLIKAESEFNKEDLMQYLEVINSVNKEYHVDYYILTESEFNESEQANDFSYEQYLNKIVNQDVVEFKNKLIEDIKYINNEVIDVQLEVILKSSYGKKTILFNDNKNNMVLEYKYNGGTFDTTYTPDVSVTAISTTRYFIMDSYTGKFKNSNKTYSVTAKGKIMLASGAASNKTFTVNFNL